MSGCVGRVMKECGARLGCEREGARSCVAQPFEGTSRVTTLHTLSHTDPLPINSILSSHLVTIHLILMFASSGLFSAIPCPYLPACPREAFCIYSHASIPATDSTSTSSSQSSSTTTPADPDKNAKRKLEKTAQPEDASNDKLSKYPRVDQRPVPRPTSSSSAKQPLATATPASTKPAIGAVLLARPQAPQKPAITSSSTSSNTKVTAHMNRQGQWIVGL
jgi:hypothetical protein